MLSLNRHESDELSNQTSLSLIVHQGHLGMGLTTFSIHRPWAWLRAKPNWAWILLAAIPIDCGFGSMPSVKSYMFGDHYRFHVES